MACKNAESATSVHATLLDGERVRDRRFRAVSGTEFREFRDEITPNSAGMDRQDSSAGNIRGWIRRARPM